MSLGLSKYKGRIMDPITTIAKKLGLDPKLLIPYGFHKAKVPLEIRDNSAKRGKMIVITGITPTKAGEGKTTTTIGLAQGFGQIKKNVVANLREPSLGPIFGIKGGGTGGGASKIEPEDEINIHFTGDAHAVGSAHNLLAALTDNVAQRHLIPGFTPVDIIWRRVTDVEERSLRDIVTGLGNASNAPLRQSGFDIVTASEIMAILALTTGLEDLRSRLSKIVVGFTNAGLPVTAHDIGAVGSMMSLLRHAILPNLVQTSEGQPVFVHTGPFGNIAHGCSSVIADQIALQYADYVLTEAGFGADLGFEKYMHIKARFHNLEPSAVVLVVSIRALKSHGGVKSSQLDKVNEDAVHQGMPNLEHLVKMIGYFGLPVVVAINKFTSDSEKEIGIVKKGSEAAGAYAAIEIDVFEKGGQGAIELAETLVSVTSGKTPDVTYLYEIGASIKDKVLALAQKVYGAEEVRWSALAEKKLRAYTNLGWDKLPICMAKTHLSLSHNPRLKGKPSNYVFQVSDIRASLGAGFLYPIAGSIVTMPGLPGSPRKLDVDDEGRIIGL